MKVRFLTIVLFSIFTLIFNSCSRSKNEVNVYVWSDYLSQDVIEEFEKETGIKVNLDTYDSNEALLEKLQTGVSKYDVVVPSDYMVPKKVEKNVDARATMMLFFNEFKRILLLRSLTYHCSVNPSQIVVHLDLLKERIIRTRIGK